MKRLHLSSACLRLQPRRSSFSLPRFAVRARISLAFENACSSGHSTRGDRKDMETCESAWLFSEWFLPHRPLEGLHILWNMVRYKPFTGAWSQNVADVDAPSAGCAPKTRQLWRSPKHHFQAHKLVIRGPINNHRKLAKDSLNYKNTGLVEQVLTFHDLSFLHIHRSSFRKTGLHRLHCSHKPDWVTMPRADILIAKHRFMSCSTHSTVTLQNCWRSPGSFEEKQV